MSEPIKRNWLAEAYKLYKGESTIQPKRQHVVACIDAIIGIQEGTKKLRAVMQAAFEEACKQRKAAGLPIPPPLPEFTEVKLS